MQIESFSTKPLQQVIPSYLYKEYEDDASLQAFVDSFNALSQGYLDWFNQAPLGLYTSPFITGPLLDWIGRGLYGIRRPVLASQISTRLAGYNANPYNTIAYNAQYYSASQTASIANDDIYKRVLTWHLYRGDGMQFCMQWLKNRVNRFVNGANGSDYPVLNSPPWITVSGTIFTITSFDSQGLEALILCYANGALQFPFAYQLQFNVAKFANNGGLLTMQFAFTYPTNPTGLSAGSVWWNGGVVSVIPGVTPDPSAPPLYFSTTSPAELLALGGGNLPLSNPGVTGQLWNNGGAISIA
ncbi:hypothetical protein [Burkholderia multivorans]|uniref:Uncharacterized protein n=1 Tax=Burkholderia multivorans TaxID=87883 RepID=A0A2S9MBN2_9BURK|nr:hypothetical protein [Burkholderia multivorans]MBU9525062.1 hypothetical protein [Burkholderia multivorans]MBU9536991.1 hypothetical protein [Burkholderia multivorans]MBU9635418.1 hypothetical protein [Burkholderia multivorans]PRF08668.1 hypothetical protein C6Q07_11280 [Burkholderia multivorans]PRF54698.1 hypothetical protein C6Q15_28490 [Burkholderia multivorans]